MTGPYLLAIDQGTTSTRAIVYDARGLGVGSAAQELTQHYPRPGWVEHDAEEIWRGVREVVPRALEAAGVAANDLAAVGLTNQRETSLFSDRTSGQPAGRPLVWQAPRQTDFSREHQPAASWMHQRTGHHP